MRPIPFADSRRLTGPSRYFAGPGAVLEAVAATAAAAAAADGDAAAARGRATASAATIDTAALARWRDGVVAMRAALGWPEGEVVAIPHASGATLALEAPADQLFTATEVNEWAWLAAVDARVLHAPGHPPAWDADAARDCLHRLAAGEARPALRALLAAATARGLPALVDEDTLSLGLGAGGRHWPLAALPAPDAVPWPELRAVPAALVTGSNGKTTTTRLLAAMLRAHGWTTGHCCTDGVFVAGERLQHGDWSGPAGARAVLRDPRVTAAVLETARGGLLRRGLALDRAGAAVVTNISADHFGEYGIHDLDGLAAAKLTVARALGADGVLVLNAEDPVLCAHADAGRIAGRDGTAPRLAWFALDDGHPRLVAARDAGLATCGVHQGVLRLGHGGVVAGLADTASMPLAAGGVADYNIGNAAAASLAAHALGVPVPTIAAVLARFGSDPDDNPGRLQRWHFGGIQVLMDYAHNPDGLRALLQVARAAGDGRLGLLLGQAGNRPDEDLRALAATAAEADPAFVVLKDIDGYLRGRAPGDVAAVIGTELRARGIPADRLLTVLPEYDAARALLRWARPGDVLVMPVHALGARAAVAGLLDELQLAGGFGL